MKRLVMPMLLVCQGDPGCGYPTHGWVEARLPSTGEVIAVATAGADGVFAMPLDPGSYRIQTAIDGNHFVDDVGVLEVTSEGGW